MNLKQVNMLINMSKNGLHIIPFWGMHITGNQNFLASIKGRRDMDRYMIIRKYVYK